MTRLLVSVRNAAEAQAAVAGGADLVDVKEPDRGPLGAADASIWRAVNRLVAGRVPTSVALGELAEANEYAADDLAGIQYAKLGLAGCQGLSDWAARWNRWLRSLPNGVEPVAVAYADWGSAFAPAPQQVIAQAERSGCRVILFDTYAKSGGNLIQHLGLREIDRLCSLARRRIGRVVFGGSLDAASAAQLLFLRPDYIAVRGAVCRGMRTGTIERARVAELACVVHGGPKKASRAGPLA